VIVVKSAWRRVRRLARRAGLDIRRYPPRHLSENTLAWQIQRIIQRSDVYAVVDVGAHHGEFATMMRSQIGWRGPILSFEPSSASFRELTTNMSADAAWSGHRVALGAAAGAGILNVFESTNLNSLHRQSDLGAEQLDMDVNELEAIEIVRLDDIDLPSGPILLKIDTQGHDLEVLQGAAAALERTTAIVVEVRNRSIYHGAPLLTQMIDELSAREFELASLHPLLMDADGLRVIEFDAVFLARRKAPPRLA
jgi:FkbM family methyltransferase